MRFAPAVVVVLLGIAALGCDDEPERAGAAPGGSGLGIDAMQVCPAELPRDPDEEFAFGTEEPADAVPSPGEIDRAWVCVYRLGGAREAWERVASAVVVDDVDLPDVRAAIELLEVPPRGQACSDDLGPRYLVATLDGRKDLTGYAVDDFGCRAVRITDDPRTIVAGEPRRAGVVPGVLHGGWRLIELIQRYVE